MMSLLYLFFHRNSLLKLLYSKSLLSWNRACVEIFVVKRQTVYGKNGHYTKTCVENNTNLCSRNTKFSNTGSISTKSDFAPKKIILGIHLRQMIFIYGRNGKNAFSRSTIQFFHLHNSPFLWLKATNNK
jgi:hypothetical protein